MIKIYINPKNPELIFAVAAIISSFEKFGLIALIAADPFEMSTKDLETSRELANQTEKIVDNISQDAVISNFITADEIYENLPEEQVFLFNIHPVNKTEEGYLINFVDKHKETIMIWADTSNYWEKGLLHYLQTEISGKLVVEKNKSCLQILKDNGFKIPGDWLDIERDIISSTTTRNHFSDRYLTALNAAHIVDINMNSKVENYCNTFKECVNEICCGQQEANLDYLIQDFLSAKEDTRRVKAAIDVNSRPLLIAGKIDRPIGYIELKGICKSMDMLELLEYGSQRFPWLFIILYSIEDDISLLANSKKLPLEIMEKYATQMEGANVNELIPLLRKEVTNFQE